MARAVKVMKAVFAAILVVSFADGLVFAQVVASGSRGIKRIIQGTVYNYTVVGPVKVDLTADPINLAISNLPIKSKTLIVLSGGGGNSFTVAGWTSTAEDAVIGNITSTTTFHTERIISFTVFNIDNGTEDTNKALAGSINYVIIEYE